MSAQIPYQMLCVSGKMGAGVNDEVRRLLCVACAVSGVNDQGSSVGVKRLDVVC